MEITAQNIQYKTLTKPLLNGISFNIQTGKPVSICGNSGSGKTALLLIIGGFLKPSSGSIHFDQKNIYSHLCEYRKMVGVGEISKNSVLVEEMTIRENLLFYADIYGKKLDDNAIFQLFKVFGIESYPDTPIMQSPPLVRALTSLMCSMVHNPQLIFMDEPTTYLTVKERINFWNIANRNLREKTVFFTTKDEQEADVFSEQKLVLSNGHLTTM